MTVVVPAVLRAWGDVDVAFNGGRVYWHLMYADQGLDRSSNV